MAITATDILFKLSTTDGAAGNANPGRPAQIARTSDIKTEIR